MNEAFEVLSRCALCRVEAAVVELIDPAAPDGLALHARCRLCGREERLGQEVAAGQVPSSEGEALAALLRWAEEEGETDLVLFCEGGFGGMLPEQVAALLLAGEEIETSFDVVAWLFSSGGSAGASRGAGGESAPTPVATGSAPERLQGERPHGEGPRRLVWSPPPPPPPPSRDEDPYLVTRAMASVVLADGHLSAAERSLAERLLAEGGWPRPRPEDLKVWRPVELGRPAEPERVLGALVKLAWADGQRDATEWRVVRELARAWGVPIPRLLAMDRAAERRYARVSRRLWLTLQDLFLVERV